MAKKIFGRVLPLLLVICMLFSMTAMAATTYYVEVTITGPDANGVNQTVTGRSSKYGSLSSPLAAEVVQVIYDKLEKLQAVFAWTGLKQVVMDGLNAFSTGEGAWESYVALYEGDTNGGIKDILSDMDSTFADLTPGKANVITYQTEKGTTYVVTITLRTYSTGSDATEGTHGQDQEKEEEPAGDINDGYNYEDCPEAEMADLDLEAWYHDGVHFCVENGLMKGYSGNEFAPHELLTRAQIAQILFNCENEPNVDVEEIFNDVALAAWYAEAVTWANDAGVVLGYGDGNFGPEDPITREQMVAVLYRYCQLKGYDVSSGEDVDLSKYTDADQISSWAVSAMKWAYAEGIISGVGNGKLDPGGSATRAQAATMLMRFCQKFAA